jgi:hypothetical protein
MDEEHLPARKIIMDKQAAETMIKMIVAFRIAEKEGGGFVGLPAPGKCAEVLEGVLVGVVK